jgi:tetratricopeptide (TPR) repeat protein
MYNRNHNRVILRVVLLTVLFMASSAAFAADIPLGSWDKLADIFASVRDGLWHANDHYWHEGDYERCIATLKLITQVDPHDTEAWSDGSWLMWNQNRIDEAEAFLIEGIALNRDVDDLYFDLGLFYYNAKRFPEAINQFETALAISPDWRTWHMLAHAYEHAGIKSEALNIWLMMEPFEPDSPVPGMQIDRIMAGLAPGEAPPASLRSQPTTR